MSGYKRIQFIGYSISTGPKAVREDARKETMYTGDQDPVVDLGKRSAFLRDVLEKVSSNSHISQNKDVLKLLMLPEFFFRGQEQAYEMRHVDNLIASLKASVIDSQWQDWVFVFGTVIGAGQSEGNNGADGYQYCLIQQGGRNKGKRNSQTRIVMREHLAENEFITVDVKNNEKERWERSHHCLPPEYWGVGMEEQQNHYDGRSIFELEGITFGLEIGQDHEEGRLKFSSQYAGHKKVQIQLIPSCGAEILSESVVAAKEGWVFSCDGLNECDTDLRKVITERSVTEDRPAQIALYPQLPPYTIRTSCKTEELFNGGAGKIRFYEPVEIPEPIIVQQTEKV